MRGGCKAWEHHDVCFVDHLRAGGYGAQMVMYHEDLFVRRCQEGDQENVQKELEEHFKQACVTAYKDILLKAYASTKSDQMDKGEITAEDVEKELGADSGG